MAKNVRDAMHEMKWKVLLNEEGKIVTEWHGWLTVFTNDKNLTDIYIEFEEMEGDHISWACINKEEFGWKKWQDLEVEMNAQLIENMELIGDSHYEEDLEFAFHCVKPFIGD